MTKNLGGNSIDILGMKLGTKLGAILGPVLGARPNIVPSFEPNFVPKMSIESPPPCLHLALLPYHSYPRPRFAPPTRPRTGGGGSQRVDRMTAQ